MQTARKNHPGQENCHAHHADADEYQHAAAATPPVPGQREHHGSDRNRDGEVDIAT